MPTFDQIKSILSNRTVGIAGAGGLGSNVAVALTRTGIGKLIIADFDIVSESNLNRQFYFCDQLNRKKVDALKENLIRINPDVRIEIHDIELNRENLLDIFSSVDVMVEAFDAAEMKELIVELFQAERPNTPLVVGNGMAGWGESKSIEVQTFGNLYICGDNVSAISPELPAMAPRVGICASMQANTVLTLLLEKCFGDEFNPKP